VTETDAEGRFVLEHAPSSEDSPEPVLRYRLALWCQVVAKGTSARWFRVQPPDEGATLDVTLVWHEERALRGRVIRGDGTPIPGLSITALRETGQLESPTDPVLSDAEGRFAFDRLVPGTIVLRVGDGEEGTVLERRVELSPTGDVPDVHLVLGGNADTRRLEVAVLDPQGKPFRDAIVRRLTRAGPRGSEARTASSGVATLLEAFRPRDLVVVSASGWAPLAATVDARALESGRLEVRLPAGRARGRVTRLDGSAAVGKLRITQMLPLEGSEYARWVDGSGSEVATDDEGRFEILGLGDGEYRLRRDDLDLRLVGGHVEVRAGDDVRVLLGTEEEVHDLFVEAETIDAEAGRPLQGWILVVRLVASGATARSPRDVQLQQVTGSESVYRTFDPVPPGTYDVVSPAQLGFREARARDVRVAIGIPRRRLALTLDRGERVRGHVLDLEGKQATNVIVEAGGQRGVVREDGTYEIRGLEEGPVDVRVTGEYAESPARRTVVARGEPAVVDFKVARGGAIRLDPGDAEPSTRFVATARPHFAAASVATLDLDARRYALRLNRYEPLALTRLPAGRWRVEVEWDGRPLPAQEVEVSAGETTTVSLRP
jgi:hypothetical protein